MLSIAHYFFLSFALFLIGVIGVVMRRNVIIVLMSIELILNAVNINLVAFSRLFGDAAGQVFALFIIADAAAEAVVGLAIMIAFFRHPDSLFADETDLLKW
ncbi:MAG TPA: NADH-quinone oxidoreductase subunit NuoK [Candidatus Dormibacteraeota bacterium]|nr:NADH-quinone oxidoreductase subunit NuoK [Candidatus Dormibacteraeota bacterium]